jgi:hypothetical protein
MKKPRRQGGAPKAKAQKKPKQKKIRVTCELSDDDDGGLDAW